MWLSCLARGTKNKEALFELYRLEQVTYKIPIYFYFLFLYDSVPSQKRITTFSGQAVLNICVSLFFEFPWSFSFRGGRVNYKGLRWTSKGKGLGYTMEKFVGGCVPSY